MFNPLRKLFSSTTHYNRAEELKKRGLTDSSLRSRVVKPEPKKLYKLPSYKNYNWGKGVGK
jgi:hypothetical protein